jgi:curved DNA-binding protein CbpA
MAFRALVKKYHPDRFSSWGHEYMDRAHEITILLQKARDTMMKTSA